MDLNCTVTGKLAENEIWPKQPKGPWVRRGLYSAVFNMPENTPLQLSGLVLEFFKISLA